MTTLRNDHEFDSPQWESQTIDHKIGGEKTCLIFFKNQRFVSAQA